MANYQKIFIGTILFFGIIYTGIGYNLPEKLKNQINYLINTKVNNKNGPIILKKIENIDKTKINEKKKVAYDYVYNKVKEKINSSSVSKMYSSSGIVQENIIKTSKIVDYNDEKYITKTDNSYGKGLSFFDSTKVAEEGKILLNGHRYVLQSDDYYNQMNENKTPLKVAGSFGINKTLYHTEQAGFIFDIKDGVSSQYSGTLQKIIDLIRYNENFYFQDIYIIQGDSIKTAPKILPGIFGGVSSFKEFLTIGNALLKKSNLLYENITFKDYILNLQKVATTTDGVPLLSVLNLKY